MIKDNNPSINQTLSGLRQSLDKKANVSVFGLSFGQKALFLSSQQRQIVFVTSNVADANKLKKQLNSFGKNVKALFFGEKEFLLNIKTYGQNIVDNILSLTALCKEKVDCLILSPEILSQKFPEKSDFENSLITIKNTGQIDLTKLIQSLVSAGYRRTERVQNVGDFSVRGDTIDIYNFCDELPTRIVIFDDEIENMFTFDIASYKKVQDINSITIVPVSLAIFNPETKSQILQKISTDFERTKKGLEPNEISILTSNFEEFKLNFDCGNYSSIQNWIFPYMNENSIFSYVNDDALVVFDDVKQIVDITNKFYEEFENDYNTLIKTGNILSAHKNLCVSKSSIFDIDKQKLSFQNITTANRIFNPDEVFSFKSVAQTNYDGNFDLLIDDIKYYLEFKNKIIIFSSEQSGADYLCKFINSKNINCQIVDFDKTTTDAVNVVVKYVPYGAIFVEDRLVVIGSDELKKQVQNKKLQTQNKKEEFSMPKIGDYVVHESFGVGLCAGIQKLKFTDYEKDYIILQYDGGDKLYLPTEQIGLISSYVANGKAPKLNKLGSKDFEKTKQKVKSSLKQLAFDLVALYSKREQSKGYVFELDEKLFAELERSFAYETTADQRLAIEEIKKDMCSSKIMDRLVCGDVGYGKTEVAIRSAFISAINNKQVAFLAPTTVLSQQHYNTAKERLSKFGIEVECLNRFKSKKEQTEILKKLKDGQIDVICGTHRLLSKDVEFKNLGLLILDEEQRFGVGDKEKIKNIKSTIDVLTLSATPIPRTLHMGLVGIRDISIIATPPSGRLPVQTTVTELSDGLLLQAINRELGRGGQVLIVYNKVETIYDFASHIRGLVGNDAQIGVAHGQMNERELEKQILDLYNGETQILVSTTLIENGVDLPNANTLIIIDSDKLGLSQLYQLKGRVGRSKNLGYAYFTYDKNKVLSEEAYKRLNAIMEFTELGSGFKIAKRDLEIRGCGNILGPEQSGHMAKVGYDMYCKILNDVVKEIKGQKNKQYKDLKLDVAVDSFIPDSYILQSDDRFRVYTNLKQIKDEQSRNTILNQVENMYGTVPDELKNLSYVALLRNLAREFDAKRISVDRQKCQVEFYCKEDMLNVSLTEAQKKFNVKVYYSQSGAIANYMLSEYSVKRKLSILCEVFEFALNTKLKSGK